MSRYNPPELMKPTRQRLVQLILPVLLLFFVTIGLSLFQTVTQVNQVDAQRSRMAVNAAMDAMVSRLADYTHDNAYWDEVARAVYATPTDMAFLNTTLGATTQERVYADTIVVISPSGVAQLGFRKGQRQDIRLTPALTAALSRLQAKIGRNNRPATTIVRNDKGIALVAISPIRPMSTKLRRLVPAEGPSYLVLLKNVGREDSFRISRTLQLSNVRFQLKAGRDPFVALRNDEGRPVGVVTWSPPSLGLVALGRAMPVIVVAALIYLIAAAVSIGRGYASLRQLGWQVMADSLSRLPNRRALRWEMIRRGDSREEAGLAILDLDGFKMVNDSFGHETGDQLIKAVAALLKQAAGTDATAIRLGGDEFALLATADGAWTRIEEVANRLLLMLDTPVMLLGRPVQVGASVGIVRVRLGDLSPSEAMRRADAAMYVAKRSGKKRVVYYSAELDQEHVAAAKLTGGLRKAIEGREFTVQYQPMIDCRTGNVVSVEALLRWPHADLGTLSAQDFINVADQAGLTVPIGALVLDQIAKDAQDWGDVRLAVNLSRGQLRSPGFLVLLEAQLKALQLAPERMEFEMREELFVENAAFAEEIAGELRQMGCRLVLDNFGSGFAAFNTLDRADFAKVKIDTTLVSRAASDDRALVLLQSCVAVAHSHGARAVAQGVETFAQAELMRIVGCDEIQGWTYGRPISATDITSLLSVRTMADPAATPAAYDEARPLFELERVSG